MSKKVVFDMDGTLYDLYGLSDWLYKIEHEQKGVFDKNLSLYPNMVELLDRLLYNSWQIAVCTWTPLGVSPEYERVCADEKRGWLAKYAPQISEIYIVPYGMNKGDAVIYHADQMVLIDDNREVCEKWKSKGVKYRAFQTNGADLKEIIDWLVNN